MWMLYFVACIPIVVWFVAWVVWHKVNWIEMVAGCVMKSDLGERHVTSRWIRCTRVWRGFPRRPHPPTLCIGRSATPTMSCK